MTQLDGKSMDIVSENVTKLKELFPEIFDEGKIDFVKLQEELGSFVDTESERYNFTWNGKSEAKQIAQTPSTGTLRPCVAESKNWDTTQNLYIEGDNLEVLKLLQKSYHKQVKMIYIDPPYNTGKDFVYKDNFHDNIRNYLELTGQVDSEGNKLSTNSDTNGRYHSDWLNMIYPRLKLARNLLRDDGVIFISIDDNEVANLRKVCDEIFGEDNFVANILWKKKTNGNNMGYIPPVHDHILVFAKSVELMDEKNFGLPMSEEYIKKNYSNPDNHPKGLWTTMDLSANHKGPNFQIINPTTGEKHFPSEGRYWVFNAEEVSKRIQDGRIIFGKNGNAKPVQRVFLEDREEKKFKAETWWDKHGMNSDGTTELKDIFGISKIFDHSKPSKLLSNIVNIATESNDIILDFFSGSATTAHAVMELNRDGGNRKYICVQLPETTDENSEAYKAGYKNICEIGKERIRRAGDKIVADNSDKDLSGLDIGFKVLKLDSSNIKTWDSDFENLEANLLDAVDNVKRDRTVEDLLYEVLLKYGLNLTLPVEEKMINGKKVFVIGFGALIICLDDEISLPTVEGIAKLKEEYAAEKTRVVFKDSSFVDAVVKTNALQTLKQFGIDEVVSI